MNENGIPTSTSNSSLLIRFYMDASEWVPHPYAPPDWATFNFNAFSQYIVPSEEAFTLCIRWKIENSIALTSQLRERLRRFPIQIGARYRFPQDSAYADVAFLMPVEGKDSLSIKPVWKGETALYQLVKRLFPDSIREYSPPWLSGQRIDIYIPSIHVAFEYHGQQHYSPVEYFGGRRGFVRLTELDHRKVQACEGAGVSLIEWKYTEPITESNLRSKLLTVQIDGT